jgi:hypothetical protein
MKSGPARAQTRSAKAPAKDLFRDRLYWQAPGDPSGESGSASTGSSTKFTQTTQSFSLLVPATGATSTEAGGSARSPRRATRRTDPLALVEELHAESEGRRTEHQFGFFGPFSELSFEEKVDF